MKSEDIGTFGDINALEFLGTGLDREQKESANEDAFRQLNNKFKFSAELAFLLYRLFTVWVRQLNYLQQKVKTLRLVIHK